MSAIKWLITEIGQKNDTYEIPDIVIAEALEIEEVRLKEAYREGQDFAIINECAKDSTSAAHKFSVFRDQIIEAFDQGVIGEFTHQVTGAPETSGQEYFNQTYGDGVQ
jgi:hypothetical protein